MINERLLHGCEGGGFGKEKRSVKGIFESNEARHSNVTRKKKEVLDERLIGSLWRMRY